MSYKYINPGYYSLFDGWSAGNNVVPQQHQKTDEYTKNPLNGIGFDLVDVYYKIPLTSTILFFSIGVYVPRPYPYISDFSFTLENDINVNFSFGARGTVKFEKQAGGGYKKSYPFFHKLEYERYNRILFKIDTTEGSIDIWINGEQLYSQKDNGIIKAYDDLKDEIIAITTGNVQPCFFSNFIISDEEIKPNEDVLVLPKGAIEASVSPNEDGSYTFTQVGQYVLMDAVVTPLKDNDIITGVAAIAYPGYSTGDNLYNVQGIDKDSNGIVTEHGIDAITSDALSAMAVSYGANMTKSELDAYKIGLRAVV